MTAPRYHHGNLRVALLEAGVRMAREGGPAVLQLRDLATAAGVTPSAVYRHFPDLAHLSADVSRLARQALAQAMLDAADAVPFSEHPGTLAIRRFDAIGRAYVAFAVREPRLFDTAFQVAEAQPSCDDDPSAWDVLTNALDAMVQHGELAPEMRADAPMVAWSAVHGFAGVLVRQMLPPPHTTADATEAVHGGVRRALGLREDALTAVTTCD